MQEGRKDLTENYSPVTFTRIVSNVLEHIVFFSISRHLETETVPTPQQHGFRSGHSCESQLILAQAVDACKESDAAILDFSKAFDTVHQQRLKSNLEIQTVAQTDCLGI